MNRQERRKRERAVEKDMSILKKLPEKELLKINEIINKLSRQKADEALNLLDRSFSAILVSRGMTFKEVEELQDELGDFMKEDQEKLIELERGNVDMAKLQKEVREFIEGLIKDGKGRKEIVEESMFKFPKLSKTSANNAYGKIMEELEVQDAAAYILEDNKELKKLLEEESKEEVKAPAVKKIEIHKEKKEVSKLKIKKIELEGEFGSYIKEGNKVIAGDIVFNSLQELEVYKKKEIEAFNLRMKEIEDVYNAEVS